MKIKSKMEKFKNKKKKSIKVFVFERLICRNHVLQAIVIIRKKPRGISAGAYIDEMLKEIEMQDRKMKVWEKYHY